MNYLSGAFRYVSGGDADRSDEVRRLVERIKSASLAQDRRAALRQLSQLAQSGADRQAEISEAGLKVFYAVLDQDKQYQSNLNAVLQLLIAIFSPQTDDNRHAHTVVATNIDMFLGLPDAISLVLEQLAHPDFNIRGAALETLTAMAAYSRPTLQAALLDASLGVSRVCDALDDQHTVLRSNAVILLAMVCVNSAEVSKIVAFSGVPDKLYDLVVSLNPKASTLSAAPPEHVETAQDNAVVVQDVLELLGSLLDSSSTTRTALLEMNYVPRLVDLLAQLVNDSAIASELLFVELTAQMTLTTQNARNISLALANITRLLQSDYHNPELNKMATQLSTTNVFGFVQMLAFLEYIDNSDQAHETNLQLATIRRHALRTMNALSNSHFTFRNSFSASLCSSPMTEAATPQIRTLHTMLHDRSAALRVAAYVALRDSFIQDPVSGVPSPALINALTGSSSLMSLVQTAGADLEVDDEDEHEISIPSQYLSMLGEALKDALTLYPKSSDVAALFYSTALLSWTLFRVPTARERLLASYAHNAGNSLFPQIMRVLAATQRHQAPPVARIGLLSLICAWLYNSPSAVSAFLSSAAHLPMLVEIFAKGTENDDSACVHIKGLAAVVLGICYEATDAQSASSGESGFISGGRGPSMVIPKGTIADVIRNHIGVAEFTAKLEDIKGTPQFAQSVAGPKWWQMVAEIANAETAGTFIGGRELGHEFWYGSDITDVIDNIYAKVAAKAVDLLPTMSSTVSINSAVMPNGEVKQNFHNMHDTAPSRTMEMLIADSAKDEVLNSYKEYIKGQDETLSLAQSNIEKLEQALRAAEGKILHLEGRPVDGDSYSRGGAMNELDMQSKGHFLQTSGSSKYANDRLANTMSIENLQANGAFPDQDDDDDDDNDAELRARELAAVVAHLEEELQDQRQRSQLLMDDLDNVRRDKEDWRRKAEDSVEIAEKLGLEKEQASSHVVELKQAIVSLNSEARAKVEDMSMSNRRLAELEDRCAELTEMRKRSEQEVVSFKQEVALRAEQNIELSGKLYEAEEKSMALEEIREKLTAKLSTVESQAENVRVSSANVVDVERLNIVKDQLIQAEEEKKTLKLNIIRIEDKARQLEESKAEFRLQLDAAVTRHEELVDKHNLLTESFDKLKKESVAQEVFQLLQQEFAEQCSNLIASQQENEHLKKSLQDLEAAAAVVDTPLTPKRPRSTTGTQTDEDLVELSQALNAKISMLQSALNEAANVARRSGDELSSAEASLHELHTDRNAIQARVKDLEKQVGKLDVELKANKSAKEQSEREAFLEHQRQLEESASLASSALEHEVGNLSSKLSQVEDKYSELVKKKNELEASLESMKNSELAMVERNKETISMMETNFARDCKMAQDNFDKLKIELSTVLDTEKAKNEELLEALKTKTEQLGKTSADLCCNAAALQTAETALQGANGKYAELLSSYEEEKKLVKQMQDTLETQSSDRRSDRSSTKSMENRISTLESDLSVARQKLQRQKDAYDSKLRNITEDLKHANETIEATKLMYQASEQSANASMAKSTAILAAVRSELSSVKAEVENKTKLVEELEESKQAMEDQHELDIQTLNAKSDEAAKNLDVVLMDKEKAEAKIEHLESTVEELSKDRESCSSHNKQLSEKLHECESVVAELETKISRCLEEKATTATKLETETRRLEVKTTEYKRLVDELASEKEAHSSLHCEYEEVVVEKKNAFEAKVAVERELEQTKTVLATTEEKKTLAEQDAEDLREWGSELQVKAQRMDTAVAQFREVEKNLEDSNEALNESEGRSTMLMKELHGMKQELASINVHLESVKREKNETEQDLGLQKSRVAELQTRLREIREQHIEKLRSLEDSMRASANRCAKLETSLATAERKLAENANLADEVQAAKAEIANANRSAQSMRMRAELAENQLNELRKESENMSHELTELRDRANNSALKVLENEHNELLVCLAELEMECASLKQELGRE